MDEDVPTAGVVRACGGGGREITEEQWLTVGR